MENRSKHQSQRTAPVIRPFPDPETQPLSPHGAQAERDRTSALKQGAHVSLPMTFGVDVLHLTFTWDGTGASGGFEHGFSSDLLAGGAIALHCSQLHCFPVNLAILCPIQYWTCRYHTAKNLNTHMCFLEPPHRPVRRCGFR